jgi:hypothetical protein
MTDGYCDAIVEAFERRYDGKLDVAEHVERSMAEFESYEVTALRTYGTDVFPDVDDRDPELIAANVRRAERAKLLGG